MSVREFTVGRIALVITCASLLLLVGSVFPVLGKTTIELWHTLGWQKEMWDNFKVEYEQLNPDVEVNIRIVPTDMQEALWASARLAGEAPDMMFFGTYFQLAREANAGNFLDLTPYVDKEWDSLIYPSVKQMVSVNDRIYAIPFATNSLQVLYRVSMFEQYGFQEPQTMDELKKISDKLRAEGYEPLICSTSLDWWAGNLFAAVAAATDPELFYNSNRKKELWADPRWIKVFEVFDDYLVKGGILIKDSTGLTQDTQLDTAFMKKIGAMKFEGTWKTTTVKKLLGDEFKDLSLFPWPSLESGRKSVIPAGYAVNFGIWSESKHVKESVRFMRWVYMDKQKYICRSIGVCPAGPIMTEAEIEEIARTTENHLYLKWVEGQTGKIGQVVDKTIFYPEIANAVITAMQQLVLQKKGPEQVFEGVSSVAKE